MEKRKDEIIAQQGKTIFDEDWGWASPVLGKQRPTFAAIEKHCGLDHWRPRYKWASQDTHGSHRPYMTMLGMSEAKQPGFLVGPSNSGMVDPAQMMARSLVQATNAFVQIDPKLEFLISEHVLRIFDKEVGAICIDIAKKSLKKYQDRRRKP